MANQIDVTALSGGSLPVANPSGYLIERPSTAAEALREILDGFFIDARESSGAIQFLPRGGPAIVQGNFNIYLELGTPAVTFSQPNSRGNILVAFAQIRAPDGVPTISDTDGNTWTQILTSGSLTDGSVPSMGAWYCIANSSSGSRNTVAFNFPGSGLNDNFGGYVLEISGGTPAAAEVSGTGGTLASCTIGGVTLEFNLTPTTSWDLCLLEISAASSAPIFIGLMAVNPGAGSWSIASQGWNNAFPAVGPVGTGYSAVVWNRPFFSVPESDLGLAEDKAKLVESFADELPLAEAVTALFNDATVNYQQGKQLKARNPRIITIATKNQKIVTMPFSLTPQQARQLAEAGLYSEWQKRRQFSINLFRAKYAQLDPGDWITFTYEGAAILARILSVDVGAGLAVSLAACSDDSRNYVSGAVGETHSAFVPPASRSSASTLLFILDIPLLRDRDANAGGSGFYAALTSGDANWLSAGLFESVDDVDFTLLDASDGPVAYGIAQLPLGAPRSPWDWDAVNSLTIQMISGSLAGDSDANVLNGTNALIVGGEIIQFADSIDNGGGSFTISRLLRGRRGTEWACPTHGAFETVIGVTQAGALLREQRPLSEIGKQLFYLGVTDGETVAPPGDSFTLEGEDLMPYAPCHIGGVLDAGGNIVITWMRRTRLGWAGLSQDPVPLSEDSELYDVDILNALGAVIRTLANLSVPTATYTASQIAADFPGGIPAGGISVDVYQKSAQIGRGFKGSGIVPTPGGWPAPLPAVNGQQTFHVNGA